MANRYWVGGTANWDGTAGTKWATTSGGAGGAAVPTSADDVFFDANSGAVTCTIASGNTGAKSITCTGFTGTLAGSAAITISGSVTLVAGMTVTYSGTMTFNATGTLTTAGKTIGPVTISGSGITTTLGDALTSSGAVSLNGGTFNTAGYNITATQIITITGTSTWNLSSSTLTLSGVAAINFSGAITGLSINPGTSVINITGTSSQITTGAQLTPTLNLYNVNFTNTTVTSHTISGGFVFNNLSVAAPSTAGVKQMSFETPITINGTLSTTGTAGNRRVWFRSSTYGIAQTLTVNATPSLTDADFRDIYVIGTAAPISGTRIGDLRGIRGITASTPKTVYWVTAAGGNWSANNWAASSGGAASTDNFPLAQDTAVIENTGLNTSATVTLDNVITYAGTVTMSTRTNAMTLAGSTAYTVYGNWVLGSGVTQSYSAALTFSGRNTQTITSAGKTLSGAITVDSYGGSVELADALNIGSNTLTVTNGTFDTKNYNVTAGALSSSNSNVRTITLGSSTVSLSSAPSFATSTNLTFSAGTSQINVSAVGGTFNGGGFTFYNLTFTSTAANFSNTINGSNVFNNVTIGQPSANGIIDLIFNGNNTINGTLTVAGATAVRRIFVRSNTLGTTRTLTVNSLSATDCDFRDITIAGTAAGSSPTRAGDCGGNTGITFPAPKTVYWNLAGTQMWSATGWASSSGGTPDINNFPLAQDTAVFDNAGSVGTVTTNTTWNIGTLNMSGRTTACTIDWSNSSPVYYGNVLLGSGVTPGTVGVSTFSGRGTQTITSGGNTWSGAITVDCYTGTVQLADALTLIAARTMTLTSGTFDAVTYNVTTGLFTSSGSVAKTLKMGSGTWTLSGTGTVWSLISTDTLYKGTANIVLSDTSTTARTFSSNSFSYNKITIGGATGSSTTTFNSSDTFTEIASTKTVAHTIALGGTSPTYGKWSVTGTAGNVVTVTGTATITIAGARVSGVDYLALGTTVISATSPGEFYAGANSTGGTNAILTAAPTPVTRYWVGGTGTWDATTTTKWSATSGGAGGASVPTSADAVVFDSASNATAYTVTCTATQLRCGSLTMAGPLVGNVTWAGTAPLAIHDNVSLAATGITRSYTGKITLSGSTTGKTINTNGVTLGSTLEFNGVGSEWGLGGAINSNLFRFINGTFSTNNYNLTTQGIASDYTNSRTINLGSSVVSISGFNTPVTLGTTANEAAALTFNAGTSQFLIGPSSFTFSGNSQTFYDVSFTVTSAGVGTINGANTFNNLSVTGITSAGLKEISLSANQAINGTLTLSAGTNATMRTFLRSDTIGTTRTLTCAAVSLTDVDFRDITIAGAAAPASGTRLGDCKGNAGITFGAGANKYWNLAGSNNWSATGWATSSGGSPSANNFPLAQDTCIFESTSPGSGTTTTINAAYNIGTIDMSARTSNTMTLATGSTAPFIYGNWINGTGTTISGTGTLTFAGRGAQTITSAGKTFTQQVRTETPGGSVTLQDSLTISENSPNAFLLAAGTFNAATYNVTISGAASAMSAGTITNTRTLALGSGTWTLAGTVWSTNPSTNITVTGTGTISLTSASSKTFAGGGISYSGVTLDNNGAGTLTITGNNTFKDITNTYKGTGAATITISTTTQTVTQWTGAGESGRVLTVTGSSASSPGTLILSGATDPNVDYLTITGIRAYNLTDTWYAGANSTNNGSLGWYFEAAPAAGATGNFFLIFA